MLRLAGAGLLLVLLLTTTAITTVLAHSTGAGTCFATSTAISAMASTSATGNGGYTISLSSGSSYPPGGSVTVTISGASTFNGILIYATNAAGTRVGTWSVGGKYKICQPDVGGTCDSTSSTITHTSPLGTTSATITWTAPAAGTGTITFNGAVTVLQTQWYILNTVSITEGAAPTTVATTPATTVATTTAATTLPTTVAPACSSLTPACVSTLVATSFSANLVGDSTCSSVSVAFTPSTTAAGQTTTPAPTTPVGATASPNTQTVTRSGSTASFSFTTVQDGTYTVTANCGSNPQCGQFFSSVPSAEIDMTFTSTAPTDTTTFFSKLAAGIANGANIGVYQVYGLRLVSSSRRSGFTVAFKLLASTTTQQVSSVVSSVQTAASTTTFANAINTATSQSPTSVVVNGQTINVPAATPVQGPSANTASSVSATTMLLSWIVVLLCCIFIHV